MSEFRPQVNSSKTLTKIKLDLSPDDSLLAIAFQYKLILWDLIKGTKMEIVEMKNICDVRFNKSGDKLIFGLYQGEVFKVDLDSVLNLAATTK